ncbi:MAG TPA: hypothetical protein VH854_01690 [Thermoanaerobaculia bacterium]|jgi:hypothetical protein|nr:hypothetical protein [Thermoanaerobaculia bacterium]
MVAVRVSPGRRRIVLGLAALVVAGASVEMLTDPPFRREHWPFSPYQMYSRLPGDTWSGLRIFGVTSQGPGHEVPLLDDAYLQPMELVSLATSLDRLDRSRDRDRVLPAALRDCLTRYESLRRSGRHDGPPLTAVRLDRLKWRVVPPGRSVLVERQPVLEVAAASGGGS